MPCRHISIAVQANFEAAYVTLSNPATWSQWAAGLGAGLEPGDDGLWTVNTYDGDPAHVRFSDPNPFGVLDHTVILPDGTQVHMPLRLLRNGDGCEVVLTLFRLPQMDDAAFARDAGLVETDLAALKSLLEA
jgi:hypothetical protein